MAVAKVNTLELESQKLKNKYWVLRHGRSIPNEQGLIVSNLSNGILQEYGLAPAGVEQARAAGELFRQDLEAQKIPVDKVRIFCSPFSRARHTGEAVADVLKIDLSNLQVIGELRERYFGPALELQSDDRYQEIWELDNRDPLNRHLGGESAADVAIRVATVIPRIELQCQGCAVLIVSHGDTLQILQTIVHTPVLNCINDKDECQVKSKIDVSLLSQHRKYGLHTGELRQLV